jgi:hypothetical protein
MCKGFVSEDRVLLGVRSPELIGAEAGGWIEKAGIAI